METLELKKPISEILKAQCMESAVNDLERTGEIIS